MAWNQAVLHDINGKEIYVPEAYVNFGSDSAISLPHTIGDALFAMHNPMIWAHEQKYIMDTIEEYRMETDG